MALNDDLKKAITEALPDATCAIGWGQGPEPFRHVPLFMHAASDVDAFKAGFLSVNNPALFLPEYKGKKIVVVAKGCDSRSIGQLLAEGLVRRDDVTIIGFPCAGVIDQDKLAALLANGSTALGVMEPGLLESVKEAGESIVLRAQGKEATLLKKIVMADKCKRCHYPNTLHADIFVGEERTPVVEKDDYPDLAELEAMPVAERLAFWEKEMSRCTRCYACRNACPLCVCRDHCIAASRDPEWITQADGTRDKLFFQVIHAVHQAGRCTGCGECQRACPVGIPVLLLKRSMARSVEQLFGYEAGVSTEATPPLLHFEIEEHRIKERDW